MRDIKIMVDGVEVKEDYVLKIKNELNVDIIVNSNDFHFLTCLATNSVRDKEDEQIKDLLKKNLENRKCNCNNCEGMKKIIEDSKKHENDECDCLICTLRRKLEEKMSN